MGAPTNKEWGKIHAKAWRDPEFRKLLEQDPKKAMAQYGKEVGKTFDKVVKVGPEAEGCSRRGSPQARSRDRAASLLLSGIGLPWTWATSPLQVPRGAHHRLG